MKNKIQEIINTPRMSNNPNEEGNFCRNLYKMIIENFKSDFTIVEIGTYEGISTELFAITCQNVITIDPYELGDNFMQETEVDLIKADKMATARLARYDNILRLKMTSMEAARRINYKIDAVYIDGDHRPEMVRQDVLTWGEKVREGGYISGHDIGVPEVGDVIKELLGEPDKIYEDGSWIFKCTKHL